ncbi:alanine--tRNA ligase [Vallitalea okinawensis]|uniref:alanine--tRNA ligase n=1 Tax=Vallitalea okinawensis TaxID=2078660 RepID=UPI000CFCB447|nr:alanine--tRNA ligase [Vallitalea okinawensis]
MKANELRQMYIEFFEERGHKTIASASLLPDNDPSVLFTTAGMHPLIPYLLGEKHPLGKRLVDIQKCVRTCDIDEVGDLTHLTFFEMLGNWSLGDYFKAESISMSYDFLTTKLNIPIENIAVTVYEGDENVPRDDESYEIWMEKGLKDHQIFFYGRKENWWGPAGLTGPCGPDTEIFFDSGKAKCSETCGPACNCGKYVEIWNNVFMEYNKNADGTYSILKQKNVDTGMGFERVLAIMNGKNTVYRTELFIPIIEKVEELTGVKMIEDNEKSFRIICEHIRAATFILGDQKAITPSNTEQGYILRRLIRRAIRHCKKLGADNIVCEIADKIISMYCDVYPELSENKEFILTQLNKESTLFAKTIDRGLKQAEKYFNHISSSSILSSELAFKLYDTFGFPIEFTQELASEKGIMVDMDGFYEKFKEHQEKSRQGAEAKFKGGMADNSVQTTKLHTATHLLNGALRTVLGDSIYQKGSNITSERLRFDFSFHRKLTKDELIKVSDIVNEAIQKEINITCKEMSLEEAKNSGAVGVLDNKYGRKVKVYTIDGYSKEICGGPHIENTRKLGSFKILKEESSSSGVRRIKATIQ